MHSSYGGPDCNFIVATKRKILQKINDSKGSEVSVRTVILVYLINTFAARKTKKNLFY